MFSELTTMKIIDAIFNITTVEEYEETVNLCINVSQTMKIEKLLRTTIEDILLNYKPLLRPMYKQLYLDVTGKKLKHIMKRYFIIPEYIYINDNKDEYMEYTDRFHMDLTNTRLLKEAILCNATHIVNFLILRELEFDPEYIYYCWSGSMFETIIERFNVNITEEDALRHIKINMNYFYRNKFVEHALKSKNENFSYDDYLLSDECAFMKRLLCECSKRENYEFIGAVCNQCDFYLYYMFNYILQYDVYAILQYVNDGYKKFFNYVVDYNLLNRIRVLNVDEEEDDYLGSIALVYSQDVTDEYGRDLCMILLEDDPEDITDNKLNYATILMLCATIDYQKTDADGQTLMDYINKFSNYNNNYAKELVSVAHIRVNHQ